MRWSEHPTATQELIDSIAYYHARRAGLGDVFDIEVSGAISAIVEWPEAWPVYPGWDRDPVVRTRRVDVFPYLVVYFVRGDEAVIVAYAHPRRKPGYWRDRIES